MKLDWEQAPGPWALSTGMRGYEREAYEASTRLLPELDIFGWLRFHNTLPGALKPDCHPGMYEIHYLRRGLLHWWVERDNYDFQPGCVFIIRPGERHGGEGDSIQPCEHYWLRFGFPKGRKALPELTVQDTACLRTGFESLRYRMFPAAPDVNNFFDRLHQEHRSRKAPNAVLMARLMFHALLLLILRDYERHNSAINQRPMVTWRVRRAREWIDSNLDSSTLDFKELFKSVKATPSVLRHRFKIETGETLHEYWLRRRIEEARQQLANTDHEITRIAHGLGFSSSQYFATVFRKQTGMSPGSYRRQHAGQARVEDKMLGSY